MLFIQADAVLFVSKGEESAHDGQVAEGGCEVERGVGESGRGGVGVLEERGVRFEDSC